MQKNFRKNRDQVSESKDRHQLKNEKGHSCEN